MSAADRARAREELTACAQRLGVSPTMRQFAADPHTGLHPQTIAKLYRPGGWNAAKRDAGLDLRRGASDAELLTRLNDKARELGRAPTAREINTDAALPSATLYLNRFGTLRRALELAGVHGPRTASTEKMLADGVQLMHRHGRLPSFPEWAREHARDPRLASHWQIYRRFGGGRGAWKLFQYCVLEHAANDAA